MDTEMAETAQQPTLLESSPKETPISKETAVSRAIHSSWFKRGAKIAILFVVLLIVNHLGKSGAAEQEQKIVAETLLKTFFSIFDIGPVALLDPTCSDCSSPVITVQRVREALRQFLHFSEPRENATHL